MSDWRLKVRGVHEATGAMVQAISAVQPKSGLGRAIQFATLGGRQWAQRIAHRITGTLAGAQTVDFQNAGDMSEGRVFIDPAAVNPVSSSPPSIYGPIEHARGGSHAFYSRVISERGDYLAGRAIELVLSDMPGDTR